jgi:hypothetical protein
MINVDLIFLSRDLSPPREDVWRGVLIQGGVGLRVHRVVGTPREGDGHRWETIARARNAGKGLGTAPWVMYLDDDVVLGEGCVAWLVAGLNRKPGFAALGADCAGEMSRGWEDWDCPPHVGMAATLFRRERLAGLTFRWEPGKCECRCCCADLRRAGFGIGYLPGAAAWHRPDGARRDGGPTDRLAIGRPAAMAGGSPAGSSPARILTAFNRNHYDRFRRQFLRTLRAWGNREPLTALAYGLRPSERGRLEAAGVEVVAIPDNGVSPALRRVHDFQGVLARWPAETSVAYWDAGDVLFQGALGPLWELVGSHPDSLLVVREPVAIGASPAIEPWVRMIRDPAARRRTAELLSTHPFVNSGFAAGTVRVLLGYLRAADRLLNSILRGVLHWGDQVAMNYYVHSEPGVWREVPEGWNYCIVCRDPGTYRIRPDGRLESRDGAPVQVVHGNGLTLGPWALAFID